MDDATLRARLVRGGRQGLWRLDPEATRSIVRDMGGTNTVARTFGVKAPSVSNWLLVGMPGPRLTTLRAMARAKPDGLIADALNRVGISPFGPLKLEVAEGATAAQPAAA